MKKRESICFFHSLQKQPPLLSSPSFSPPCPLFHTSSSAICTAFSAAPFLIWSPHTKRSRPFLSLREMSRLSDSIFRFFGFFSKGQ